MEPFLKLVADDLFKKYQYDIQDICLVFPGRRAGLFLLRQFSDFVTEKPLWVPPIRTISELISDFSSLQIADPLILNFELYKVYSSLLNTGESFDTFFPFGEMLLNDFDDIDKYLVNPEQLFQNLSDLRDIDNRFSLSEEQIAIIKKFWKNIAIYEPSSLKKDFITVWNRLFAIYSAFTSNLRRKGIGYEGMVYREVSNTLKAGNRKELPFKRFAIIGFNALNECEKVFFTFLQKNNLADFYWDYDLYYYENNWHEAGFFIRENLTRYPNALSPENFKNLTQKKEIEIFSVPSDVGQAKLIPTFLGDENMDAEKISDTLIVLGDEQLLIPVLSSIPAYIKDINVTLGYSFRLTPVYSFLEALFSLHKTMRDIGGETKFYYRNVLTLLNHAYFQTISEQDCNDLIQYIVTQNRVFLSPRELNVNACFSSIFRNISDPAEYLQYLIDSGNIIVQEIKKQVHPDNQRDFQFEYWFTFLTAINRLKEILFQDSIDIGMSVLFKLLKKVISTLSTPFKGEPLAGLQVMGVLETRAIDFSTIIILSANEGIFPKTETAVSYIPYNLRKGFGLPTIEHQDAIYAYYFYRLLQRADKVFLTYNSQSLNRSGEMSRFLYQLKYEDVFNVKERNIGFSISLIGEKDIVIQKTPDIVEFMQQYTMGANNKGYLTPTALTAYLECSLRFYFKYIAKIKEKEEVTEDIEGSVFGKLFHFVMEWLYKPYIDTVLDKTHFKVIRQPQNVEMAIMQAFGEVYFKTGSPDGVLHGKSILIKEILRKYILEVLQKDEALVPFTILALEKTYKSVFNAGDKQVVIGGIVDRIDEVNGAFRIIDYKTGHIEFSCPSIERLFDRSTDTKKYSAIFQALLYSLVLKQQDEFGKQPIFPGLYGLREIFRPNFDSCISVNRVKINSIHTIEAEYEGLLTGIISELFNTDLPFTKITDKKKCEYCSYREICHR